MSFLLLLLPTMSSSQLNSITAHASQLLKTSIIDQAIKNTAPGSLKHYLWGTQPSEQSVVIRFGRIGEDICKHMVSISPNNLELLQCGVKLIDTKGKKKDFDLVFKDLTTNTVYLRELKGNIELDTEKLPATFDKIRNDLKPQLQKDHPGATIDIGILNWSVFEREELNSGLYHIKKCEDNGVPVEHMKEFSLLTGIVMTSTDWKKLGRDLGAMVKISNKDDPKSTQVITDLQLAMHDQSEMIADRDRLLEDRDREIALLRAELAARSNKTVFVYEN